MTAPAAAEAGDSPALSDDKKAKIAHYNWLASLPQFALEATNEAMDCVDRPLTGFMCVSITDWPKKIGDGDHVIIKSVRSGEVLCRKIVERDGNLYIAPRPFRPLPTEKLRLLDSVTLCELSGPRASEGEAPSNAFYVTAVVVARYRKEPCFKAIRRARALGGTAMTGDITRLPP